MPMKPETIQSLKNSHWPELREKAYQLTGSVRVAEDIAICAFNKLLQNSFWFWSEKGAKGYLEKAIKREYKKYPRLSNTKRKRL